MNIQRFVCLIMLAIACTIVHGQDDDNPIETSAQVISVYPTYGNTNGGVRLTLSGVGFTGDHYVYQDAVYVGDTPCDIIHYLSNEHRIVCTTRADTIEGSYSSETLYIWVHKQVLASCANWQSCRFTQYSNRNAYLRRVSPFGGDVADTVTFQGRLFGDSLSEDYLELNIGDQRCRLPEPDNEENISESDEDDIDPDHVTLFWSSDLELRSGSSGYANVPCKLSDDLRPGYYNTSIQIEDGYGRATGMSTSYRLTPDGSEVFQFQVYPEIEAVSPQSGSVAGGTLVTIEGSGFAGSGDVEVDVAGAPCHVVELTATRIVCETAEGVDVSSVVDQGENSTLLFPGGRGVRSVRMQEYRPSYWQIETHATGMGNFSFGHGFETPESWGEYYTQKAEALFEPPFDAEYRFSIECDDRCDVHLMEFTPALAEFLNSYSDDDLANATITGNFSDTEQLLLDSRDAGNNILWKSSIISPKEVLNSDEDRVAYARSWGYPYDYRLWDRPEQTSEPVFLSANKTYALVVRHEEGCCGDHMSLAVHIPWDVPTVNSIREEQRITQTVVVIREIQQINITGATGGSFRLYYNGYETDDIPLNATENDIRTIVVSQSNLNWNDFLVSRQDLNDTILIDATFNIANGSESLLLVDSFNLLGSGIEVEVTKIREASLPLSGTFDLSLGNQTWTDIPFDIHPYSLADLLMESPLSDFVMVDRRGQYGDGYTWYFTFDHVDGDLPEVVVDASGLRGPNATMTSETLVNGTYTRLEGPISGDFVRVIARTPQVNVRVGGMLAQCNMTGDDVSGCTYMYREVETPVIASVAPNGAPVSTGDTLTVTGSGWQNGSIAVHFVPLDTNGTAYLEQRVVVVDSVDVSSETELSVDVPALSGGDYRVDVIVDPVGRAQLDDSSSAADVQISVSIGVDSVSPSSVSVGGGVTITISGSGFGQNVDSIAVDIDEQPCDVVSADDTTLLCVVPQQSSRFGAANSSIVVHSSLMPEVEASTSEFSYDLASSTPTVSGVSPSEILSADLWTMVTISGSGFSGNGDGNTTVQIGATGAPCDVQSVSDTEIVCQQFRLHPGAYEMFVFVPGSGLAVSDSGPTVASYPAVESVLRVSHISPSRGSILGGLTITVFGDGFQNSDENFDVVVDVDGYLCDVTEQEATYLVCDLPHRMFNNRPTEKDGDVTVRVNGVTAECTISPERTALEDECGVFASCSTCAAQASAGCGWCFELGVCTNTTLDDALCEDGQSSTVQDAGVCEDLGAEEPMCSELDSCGSCMIAGREDCGWCSDPSTGQSFCFNVTSEAGYNSSLVCGIGNIVIDAESCPNEQESSTSACSAHTSCDSCLSSSDDHCFWCASNSRCFNTSLEFQSCPEMPNAGEESIIFEEAFCPARKTDDKYDVDVDVYCSFRYAWAGTPLIHGVSNAEGAIGTVLHIDGEGFPFAGVDDVTVSIGGGAWCNVLSVSTSAIECEISAGHFGVFEITVDIDGVGRAFAEEKPFFNFTGSVDSISPESGSVAGGTILTIAGVGFNAATPENNMVFLYNGPTVFGNLTLEEALPVISPYSWSVMCHVLTASATQLTCRTMAPDENAYNVSAVRVTVAPDHGDDSAMDDHHGSGVTAGTGTAMVVMNCLSCTFTFDDEATPVVTSSSPSELEGLVEGQEIRLYGNGFGTTEQATITIGGEPCANINVTHNGEEVICNVPALAAGIVHPVVFHIDPIGFPWSQSTWSPALPGARYLLNVTSIQGVDDLGLSGSHAGGTRISMDGIGLASNATVLVCNSPCIVDEDASDVHHLECVTSPIVSVATASAYDGVGDEAVLLTGEIFGSVHQGFSAEKYCPRAYDRDLTTYFDRLWFGDLTDCGGCGLDAGELSRWIVTEIRFYPRADISYGRSHMQFGAFEGSVDGEEWTTLHVMEDLPHSGWNSVSLMDVEDIPWTNETAIASSMYRFVRYRGPHGSTCSVSEIEYRGVVVAADDENACPFTVISGVDSYFTNTTTFIYDENLTPSLSSVSPDMGTSAGGTTVTLTGAGFAGNSSTVSVDFDNVACDVQSVSATEIVCVTGARQSIHSSTITIDIPGKGVAVTNGLGYQYIDRWSDLRTWNYVPPVDGDSIFVVSGQSLLVDIPNPPYLKLIAVEGALIFADELDIDLHAEYIMINKGKLQIGTEDEPFTHRATITMYGDKYSPEIPHFGSKCIAARKSVVDMHGVPKSPSWTRLNETADVNGTLIVLQDPTNWEIGDQIVIASTNFDMDEAEVRTIVSISNDGQAIEIDEPLAYKHLGIQHVVPREHGPEIVFKQFAEVGVLSRNIVIQGDESSTRTQFGVHMLNNAHTHAADGVIARYSNIEVRRAGQAFQLGRYPVHYHMSGHIPSSYVKNCSIHHTFNRAVTIHGVHELTVMDNVAFDTMGHTYFMEDGIETLNVIEGNLGLVTRQSWSNLNIDQTPATYWMTNPFNHYRRNVAAGSTHYGFWFDFDPHPSGPSTTEDVCPVRMPLLSFQDNLAHSNGRYGFRLFHDWNPRSRPCDWNDDPAVNPTVPAYLYGFHTYRNLRTGAKSSRQSDVHLIDFISFENRLFGFEFTEIMSPTTEPQLQNVVAAGWFDLEARESIGGGEQIGYVGPQTEYGWIRNITFVNYDQNNTFCWSTCSMCTVANMKTQGGYTYFASEVEYVNSPNRIVWGRPFRDIVRDLDGTMIGHGVNASAIPMFPHADGVPGCSADEEWDGVVCDGSKLVRRIAIHRLDPADAFNFRDMYIRSVRTGNTSTVGFLHKRKPMDSWVFPVPIDESYGFDWDLPFPRVWDHMQFDHCEFAQEEYVFWEYTWSDNFSIADFDVSSQFQWEVENNTEWLSLFQRDGINNGTVWIDPLSPPHNLTHGDWLFDDQPDNNTFVVMGSGNFGPGSLIPNGFSHEDYLYIDSIEARDPNIPGPIDKLPENRTRLWSDPLTWNGTEHYPQPSRGSNVQIPSHWNLVIDVSPPLLRTLTIEGNVWFSPEADIRLTCVHVFIRGGRLAAGNYTHPHPTEAVIELWGDRRSFPLVITPELNVGTKVLAVFGELVLHGRDVFANWVTLNETVEIGDHMLTLSEPVNWQIGDEIVITSTSRKADEHEYHYIEDILNNGTVLVLNSTVEHRHFGSLQVFEDGTVLDERAEIGLLTHNVKIVSSSEGLEENIGGRLYIGEFYDEDYSVTQRASVFMDSVQLTQGGFDMLSPNQPMPAILFQSITFPADNPAILRHVSAVRSVSGALTLAQSNNIVVEECVFAGSIGSTVRAVGGGHGVRIERNLAAHTWFYASSSGDQKHFYATYQLERKDPNVGYVFRDNVAAGSFMMTLIYMPERCDGTSPSSDVTSGFKGHSAVQGVWVMHDPTSRCVRVHDITMYKIFFLGIIAHLRTNVIVDRVTVADNYIGMNLNGALNSNDNAMIVRNSVIIGMSNNYEFNETATCNDQKIGIQSSTFPTRPFQFPPPLKYLPWNNIHSDPSKWGRTRVEHTRFVRFRRTESGCQNGGLEMENHAIVNNEDSPDATTPHLFYNITHVESDVESLAHVYFPQARWRTIDNCGDMDCDGPKHALFKDMDGTLLSPSLGALSTITPNNPFILPDDHCTLVDEWNAYRCPPLGNNREFMMLVVESLDSDSFDRRVAPLNVSTDDRWFLVNGPMDWLWDQGYTSHKRMSTFFFAVETGRSYNIRFTGTNPRNLRYYLLNAEPNHRVKISVPYQQPNALQVSTKSGGVVDEQDVVPTSADVGGTNSYNRKNRTLHFVVGNDPITIRQLPTVFVSLRMDVPVEDFFEDDFVNNLAFTLSIDPERIRIVDVRSGSTIVDFEIEPENVTLVSRNNTGDGNSTTDGVPEGSETLWSDSAVQELETLVTKITTQAQNGTLNVGHPILNLAVTQPKLNLTDDNSTDSDPVPVEVPPVSKKGTSTGIYIGGAIGGVLVIAIVIGFAYNASTSKGRVQPVISGKLPAFELGEVPRPPTGDGRGMRRDDSSTSPRHIFMKPAYPPTFEKTLSQQFDNANGGSNGYQRKCCNGAHEHGHSHRSNSTRNVRSPSGGNGMPKRGPKPMYVLPQPAGGSMSPGRGPSSLHVLEDAPRARRSGSSMDY